MVVRPVWRKGCDQPRVSKGRTKLMARRRDAARTEKRRANTKPNANKTRGSDNKKSFTYQTPSFSMSAIETAGRTSKNRRTNNLSQPSLSHPRILVVKTRARVVAPSTASTPSRTQKGIERIRGTDKAVSRSRTAILGDLAQNTSATTKSISASQAENSTKGYCRQRRTRREKRCATVTTPKTSKPPNPRNAVTAPPRPTKNIHWGKNTAATGKNTRRPQSVAPVSRKAHPSASDKLDETLAATGTLSTLSMTSGLNSTPDDRRWTAPGSGSPRALRPRWRSRATPAVAGQGRGPQVDDPLSQDALGEAAEPARG